MWINKQQYRLHPWHFKTNSPHYIIPTLLKHALGNTFMNKIEENNIPKTKTSCLGIINFGVQGFARFGHLKLRQVSQSLWEDFENRW